MRVFKQDFNIFNNFDNINSFKVYIQFIIVKNEKHTEVYEPPLYSNLI